MLKKLLFLIIILIGKTELNAQFVYHKDYNFNKVGSLIPTILQASDYGFNTGRWLASCINMEKLFITIAPRAYVDLCRPQNIKNMLKENPNITKSMFHKPASEVSQEELQKIHSQKYIDELFTDPRIIANICEMGFLPTLSFPPFSYNMDFFRKAALRPILLATQGTLDAVDIALNNRNMGKFGWAINLGGGFHHAKVGGKEGEDYSKWGNCAVSDEGLATLKALSEYNINKVLIVDLDAHQGNGNAWILGNNEKVAIFDMYNKEATGNYPPDQNEAAQLIKYCYPLTRYTEDEAYLRLLKEKLENAVEQERPDLIIYNAGTDPLEDDPEGLLNISAQGIIERDEYVFNLAKKIGAAIVMAPSGGYQRCTAAVIAKSLHNLVNKKIIS